MRFGAIQALSEDASARRNLNTRYAALQATILSALAHVSPVFALYETCSGCRRAAPISMPDKGWNAAPAAQK